MSGASQSSFDPLVQNVTFLGPDGETPVVVPMAAVDAFDNESINTVLNYGVQIGACIIMLLVVLLMTPRANFARPSAVLHILGLMACIVRTSLLASFFLSPFNHFYQYFSGDYSSVSTHFYATSVAATVVSLLLVVIIEAALMNQAWTMVRLWPGHVRFGIIAISSVVSLLTIGFRVASMVIQCQAIFALAYPDDKLWFCAVFNIKLISHLISSRGVLPSAKALSSMEVLVMTNGILMIVPVIFAGLEWGKFSNFEAASMTFTAVALILPLGTLVAQRISTRQSPSGGDGGGGGGVANHNIAQMPPHGNSSPGRSNTDYSSPGPSVAQVVANGPLQCSEVSKCERGMMYPGAGTGMAARDHYDLELSKIDSTSELTTGPPRSAQGGRTSLDREMQMRGQSL
ncbi:hypothetical protein RJ55_01526 [Drechmeria coniospora]|nr:hypothetical protein RJ55_01526 [Drechmeria coniospora]